jgi:hypothetical protein
MSDLEAVAATAAEQTVVMTKIVVVSAAVGVAVTLSILGTDAAVRSAAKKLQNRKARKQEKSLATSE